MTNGTLSNLEIEFVNFLRTMDSFEGYLKMLELKDKHSYKIYARNALVGVWFEDKQAFSVLRYKVGEKPYLAFEYHWDVDQLVGTAKPLAIIEKSPQTHLNNYAMGESSGLLSYLYQLEKNNPLIHGYNSVDDRRESAIQFARRLKGKVNEIRNP